MVTVGKPKQHFRELCETYMRSCSAIRSFEHHVVKEVSKPAKISVGDKLRITSQEADRIRPLIRGFLIVFDEQGGSMDSIQFSELLKSKTHVTLVVGGPLGTHPSLREQADMVISLSSMTFAHPLAAVVVLEQVYRGLSIIKGLPYHDK